MTGSANARKAKKAAMPSATAISIHSVLNA